VVGDGAELFEVASTVSGGRATARYRAGIEPEVEPVTIVAEVDGLLKSVAVKQEALETTLSPDGAFIDVVVSSAAGTPADGTKIV
jgi:hypothetical protein